MATPARSSEQVRILLVEDDAGDALLLRELLTAADPQGFRIETARRLSEGLAKLDAAAFDIALLDVHLPDASGVDGVRRVRERMPGLPILVLTGLEDPRFAATAGRAGAQDYIVKGQFSAPALAQAIRHAIERHAMEESMRARLAEIADLRRHERVQREFLSNVSHELRTPIAAIRGAAETLREGALSDKQSRGEFVAMIERHALRLSRFVEELLLIAELGRPSPRRASVPIGPLLRAEVDKLTKAAQDRKVSFKVDSETGLQALADEKHLAEALRALIRNAVDYNREGGAVLIAARAEGADVVVSVKDSGIGIASEDMAQIFERFHRAPEARALRPLGTGLGLFIVNRIAQAYGGRVWVESEAGSGSTFSLAVPKAPRSDASARKGASQRF